MKAVAEGLSMNVPRMVSLTEAVSSSGLTLVQLLDCGLSKLLTFLVVVPEIGACVVPDATLSHFMAGEFDVEAEEMSEHYSGRKSGKHSVKLNRLQILAEELDALAKIGMNIERHRTIARRFVKPARPKAIPPDLAELDDDTTISVRSSYGGVEWEDRCRAVEYRHTLASMIQRQAGGRFTLAEAAQVLADTRPELAVDQLLLRMQRAHTDGKLMVNAEDGLPRMQADRCSIFSDTLLSADVDRWLESMGASYAFPSANVDTPAANAANLLIEHPKQGPSGDAAVRQTSKARPESVDAVRLQIQHEATEEWIRWLARGGNPTVHGILDTIASWCVKNEIRTAGGVNPKAGTIRNTILGAKHWTPPTMTRQQAKKHVEQRAQVARL